MSDAMAIVLTAGLTATACCLLGPFLVLRRVALMGDAVSHAVLPGIVAAFLIFQTRAPLVVVVGAAVFAIVCVLAIEALRGTGLVASDAAIGLVFPALFALGVLGIHRYADDIHLDLDSTIYGEIAFTPFRTMEIGGVPFVRSVVVMGVVAAVNLLLVSVLWKELKVTSFDPEFARTIRVSPRLLSRLLLIAVAITAVTAFESVGAILVVTLLIVPAAAAYLLTDRLVAMVAISVAIGWISAVGGYAGAIRIDASIAGAMGLCAAALFAVALIGSPRYGLVARAVRRSRRRRAIAAALAAGPEGSPA
ncbi:metal ABC transporter permease [Miltoncostaea oceani]|uniref:metal ABC transporter permease n=1 Tax=Miltoncostaea oceani TaxID=2843216 RepID=UPI001C3E32AD|nr:metal ABC transporter permease [Miltoncostaea oceani]